MKKLILAFLTLNVVLAGWMLSSSLSEEKQAPLDFLCESTLALNNNGANKGTPFTFQGTLIVRFRPDATGYVWLMGNANDAGKETNIAREIGFTWHPKDEKGIYTITLTSQTVTPRDNTPDAVVERNISGPQGQASSYVIRPANKNTYSIGSIYMPIIMCVDRA